MYITSNTTSRDDSEDTKVSDTRETKTVEKTKVTTDETKVTDEEDSFWDTDEDKSKIPGIVEDGDVVPKKIVEMLQRNGHISYEDADCFRKKSEYWKAACDWATGLQSGVKNGEGSARHEGQWRIYTLMHTAMEALDLESLKVLADCVSRSTYDYDDLVNFGDGGDALGHHQFDHRPDEEVDSSKLRITRVFRSGKYVQAMQKWYDMNYSQRWEHRFGSYAPNERMKEDTAKYLQIMEYLVQELKASPFEKPVHTSFSIRDVIEARDKEHDDFFGKLVRACDLSEEFPNLAKRKSAGDESESSRPKKKRR